MRITPQSSWRMTAPLSREPRKQWLLRSIVTQSRTKLGNRKVIPAIYKLQKHIIKQ